MSKALNSRITFSVLVLCGVLFLGFQNCSRVEFGNKKAGVGPNAIPGFGVIVKNGADRVIPPGGDTCENPSDNFLSRIVHFTFSSDYPVDVFFCKRVQPENDADAWDCANELPLTNGDPAGEFSIVPGYDNKKAFLEYQGVSYNEYRLVFKANVLVNSMIQSTEEASVHFIVRDCSGPTPTPSPSPSPVASPSPTPGATPSPTPAASPSPSPSASPSPIPSPSPMASPTPKPSPAPTPSPSPVASPTPKPSPSPSPTTTTSTTTTTLFIPPSPAPSPAPGDFTITGVKGGTTGDVYDTLIYAPGGGESATWTTATLAAKYNYKILTVTDVLKCSGMSTTLVADIDATAGCNMLPDGTYKLIVEAETSGGMKRAASNSPFTFYVKSPRLTEIFGVRADHTWLPPQVTTAFTFKPTIINPSPYVATDIQIDTSNHRNHKNMATAFKNFAGVIPKGPATMITTPTAYTSEPLFQWSDSMTDPIGCGTQGHVFAKYAGGATIQVLSLQSNYATVGNGWDVQPGAGPCRDQVQPVAAITSLSNGVVSGTGSDADLPTTPTAIGLYLQYNDTDSSGWGGGHLLNWYRTGTDTSYGNWVADLKQIDTINDVHSPSNGFVQWFNSQPQSVRNQLLPICNGQPKTIKFWVVNIPRASEVAGSPNNVRFETRTITCNQ